MATRDGAEAERHQAPVGTRRSVIVAGAAAVAALLGAALTIDATVAGRRDRKKTRTRNNNSSEAASVGIGGPGGAGGKGGDVFVVCDPTCRVVD